MFKIEPDNESHLQSQSKLMVISMAHYLIIYLQQTHIGPTDAGCRAEGKSAKVGTKRHQKGEIKCHKEKKSIHVKKTLKKENHPRCISTLTVKLDRAEKKKKV